MKRWMMIVAMSVAGMGLKAQGLDWGVKGGLTYNMTDLGLGSAVATSGEVFSGERANNGWHLGLAVRDEIGKNFYVQFDGLYNQTSIFFDGYDQNGAPVSENFTMNSMQFNLSPGIKVIHVLRFQTGLNGNLMLDEKVVDAFGRFQLGYQLGAGVDLGPLTFDITYNASFQDHEGQWNGIPLASNRGELLMSVGILF